MSAAVDAVTAAPVAEPKRAPRPLKDRLVWLLAGHGGWVLADELARALRCQEAEAAAVLVALAGNGVVEARSGVGWRLAGPALAREAARELVRVARDGVRRQVHSVVDGEVVRMGVAEVRDGGADGGGLGFLLVEMVAPLPAGPDGLERLQALVNQWCRVVQEGVFDV